MRVVVVGARRRRQGIGLYLGRFCAQAGAEVVGVIGTTAGTVEEACRALAEDGPAPRGSVDARALLRRERPDVLVIASPHKTHDDYLALALEEGLHVLCEKPLCWGGTDVAERARGYVQAFQERGLHLGVNAQWPFTLDTYRRLFPDALRTAPDHFWMRLSPRDAGESMIPHALPHALSLLLAVQPYADARVENAHVHLLAQDASHVEVSFDYVTGAHTVRARVDLKQSSSQPREAGYGFDGHRGRRTITPRGYRFHLEGGGARLPLPDPTPRLVTDFLARVSSSEPPVPDLNAWPGMALLQTLHDAWPRSRGVHHGPEEVEES